MPIDKEQYIAHLFKKFESYAPISENSKSLIASIVIFQELKKYLFMNR